MPFVKLDTGILDSSLWSEPSSTRICWITLLAMADSTGLVRATAPGIANRANLGVDETRKALEVFESPDPNSRSTNDDGRKIRRVDGGYEIINYMKYREIDYTAAERMRRFRLRRNERNSPNKTVTLRKQKQKQSTEAEKKKGKNPLVIPSVLLAVPNFENEWEAFKQMRLAKRARLTDRAAEIILNRLAERPDKSVVALSRCVEKNWTSFEWDWINQTNGVNGRVDRQMSAFEIEKRVAAISQEINLTFKKNGGRVAGDGIDELKQRRDSLQKQLLA